jgi:hypothetical protein
VFKMFRRFLWLIVGFALGASSSWAVTRRFRRAARRYVPSQVRDRWSENVRAAMHEGRRAMRTREAELKGTGAPATGK